MRALGGKKQELLTLKTLQMETTVFFNNLSQLLTASSKRKVYAQLSNGYYTPVTKKDLKILNRSMQAGKFAGTIMATTHLFIHIKFNN